MIYNRMNTKLDPTDCDDLNPSDEARHKILTAMLNHAGFDGWTGTALARAVTDADLPEGAQDLYFPAGPLEVIEFWHEQMDIAMTTEMSRYDLLTMRIRDKVTKGVLARLLAIGPHELAAKRAMHRLALPDAIGRGPKLIWNSADAIWRAIGDTSTDFNYYTKRTTLSAVIGSSALSWISDDSAQKTKARAFLDARIENVMQFEKTKFKVKSKLADLPDLGSVLGGLRFGGSSRFKSSSRR